MQQNAIKLRNGTEEHKGLVTALMMSLGELLKSKPIAFYELVSLARSPGHELWGNTREVLSGLMLVDQQGNVHDSCRNIILSATEGDGLELTLRSPIEDAHH